MKMWLVQKFQNYKNLQDLAQPIRSLGWMILLGVVAFLNFACKFGGGLNGAIQKSENNLSVLSPNLIFPQENPFSSPLSEISLSGQCANRHQVIITDHLGLIVQQIECKENLFTFNLNQSKDGFYFYSIFQISEKSVQSSILPFIWHKKSSIAQPGLISPAQNPYLSSSSSLLIQGSCESGAHVSVKGDGSAITTCVNSAFSLSIPKSVDGDYHFEISQTDSAGNTAQISLNWKKKNLTATPLNPTLIVKNSQKFDFSGGSGVFTASLSENNSGGSFDPTTNTYVAGTRANVIDQLTLKDSYGGEIQISIRVAPSEPDHLSFPMVESGDDQTTPIGQDYPLPLKVLVVDQYENTIFGYPLFAQVVQGDAILKSSPVQFSGLNGEVIFQFKAGSHFTRNRVVISPLAGTLPDVAGTSQTRLEFKLKTQFSNKNTYGFLSAVGQVPQRLILDRIDNDSFNDAVVLNNGDPSIGIFLGLGNSLFQNMRKVTGVCQSPTDLIVKDLDGDGFRDLIVSCGNSANFAIQYFLNLGSGNFGSSKGLPLDPSESIPSSLIVEDFDKDGRLDLITTNAGSSTVSIRYGQANMAFSSPTVIRFPEGSATTSVKKGDFNQDGLDDLVVMQSATDSFDVIVTQPGGSFDTSLSLTTCGQPVMGQVRDYNEDGAVDIAILCSSENKISVLLNDKEGGFNESISLPVGDGGHSITAADVNKDARIDLAVTNNVDSTVSLFLGNGNGTFLTQPPIATLKNPTGIDFGTVNGDSSIDLVLVGVNDKQMQVLPQQAYPFNNPGDPLFYFGSEIYTFVNPTDLIVTDITNDFQNDLVVLSAGSRQINFYTGDGQGQFNLTGTSLNTNDESAVIRIFDSRSLGRQDILVVNPSKNTIRMFLQNSDLSYQTPIDLGVTSNPFSIEVRDFNKDGVPDLAVANLGANSISVLIGNGDGSFQSKVDYPTGGGPRSIYAADIDNDGILDLLTANSTTNSFSLLMGNGNGTFRLRVDTTVATGPTQISAADLNSDGNVDVLVLNAIDSVISVNLGNGDGSFRATNFYPTGDNPKGFQTGDFNDDGRLDLMVPNSTNNFYTVLLNSALGQFNISSSFNTDFSIEAIRTGDISGDGKVDIFLFDSLGNRIITEIGR